MLISVEFGGWFDVTLEMEKVLNTGEHKIYPIYYEDLKQVGYLREMDTPTRALTLEVEIFEVEYQGLPWKKEFALSPREQFLLCKSSLHFWKDISTRGVT